MRLVCLECSAAYDAPDNLFGPQPRDVRCNRCGYQWTVVGSAPEEAAPPDTTSGRPAEASAPMPAMPPLRDPKPERPSTPPVRAGSSRLADTLAGPRSPNESVAVSEPPRPVLAVEPPAASTRTLLTSSPSDAVVVTPPDPEEKRLSHELDFGESERRRRTPERVGGTRRAVLILILLLILLGVVAVIFKTQIIVAVPALQAIYAQVGL